MKYICDDTKDEVWDMDTRKRTGTDTGFTDQGRTIIFTALQRQLLTQSAAI